MRLLTALIGSACLALAAAHAAHAADDSATPGPSEVVKQAAESMLAELDARRAELRKDPQKVGELVEKHLLPHFDTEYAARLVLGRHWRTATPEQRKRFVDAFYHSMLRNYGNALVDFTSDRLRILPTKVAPDAERATVRTEVTRSNGERVPVNYSMRKTPEGWKAWDVVIEGISYVKSFREDLGMQIDQQGIDAVIKRLESGAKPATSA